MSPLSFAPARQDAWETLGTPLPDTFTAADALKHGNLSGWNLRKVPLVAPVDLPGGGYLELDIYRQSNRQYAIVRNNPHVPKTFDALGIVGETYPILQNEETADLLDTIADESGATFGTAGEIDGGRRAFVTMKLPGSLRVGGVDRIDNYIVLVMGLDGNASTQIMVTPVRTADRSVLNASFNNSPNAFRVRHTSGAHKVLLQQAREALDFTFDYLEGFQQEADRLVNTPMTYGRFEKLISKGFGAPKGAPAPTVTRTGNKLDQMAHLFATPPNVQETAWTGFTALADWYDHYSPVRGAGAVSEDLLRARKALLDPGFKEQARSLVLTGA